MASDLQPPNDRKRVKVYELRDNDWFDRGTGFCMGQILDVSFCRLPGVRKSVMVCAKAVIGFALKLSIFLWLT
jgi:hypothetical protein